VKNYNKIARQAGMTLIELTVVLLVLIGLAGLMIPYVSGFVGKTHDATGSSNIQQLGNAIVRYESQFGSYPDNMDSLISGVADTAAGAVIDYTMADVMGGTNTALANYGLAPLDITVAMGAVSTVDADGEVCGSLAKAGINTVIDMDVTATAGFNATFANSVDSVGAALTNTMMTTCTGLVAEMPATFVADALGIDTTNKRYVAFGIGQNSKLVGKTLQEAPVHFAKNADMNASQAYNRFVAIFEVDNDVAVAVAPVDAMRARYAGSVMLMGDVVGLQTELGNYYKSATDEAN